MNGFDDDTWAALLHDPRLSGEAGWGGAGAGDPFPWQHEIVAESAAAPDEPQAMPPSLDDLAFAVVALYAPWTLPGWIQIPGNLPLDDAGMPFF